MWWSACETVYCGFWINWEYGPIKGSNLTLPSEWGLVLNSFVSLFVKTGGENLWMIICFIVFQLCASSKKQDDMYHQFQLILRNTESVQVFVKYLLQVCKAHKGARFEAYRRSFLLIVFAVLHGTAFYAASLLSSNYVASYKDPHIVRVASEFCGSMEEPALADLTNPETLEMIDSLMVVVRNGYRRSLGYSKACYAHSGTSSVACDSYVLSALPYNTTRDSPCPFEDKICNGHGVTFDTGPLRSDRDIGINTRPEDSISARKSLTCAPLAGENYADEFPMPEGLGPADAIVKGYKFGDVVGNEFIPGYTIAAWNAEIGDKLYNLWIATSMVDHIEDKGTTFLPIPELRSSDSDVNLIGLLNRVNYNKPVKDRWFNAQNCSQGQLINDIPLPPTCPATNVFASWIACKERYQFCTANSAKCSPLTGLHGITPSSFGSPGLNPTQAAVFNMTWTMMRLSSLNFQVGLNGVDGLVANEYLWDGGFGTGMSAGLPDNQWEIEVQNWMNTTLALIQRSPISYSRPPEFDVGPGISTRKHIVAPPDPESRVLCHKIKAKSTAHSSFTVLGLALTLAFGTSLSVLNSVLPKLVASVQKRTGKGAHRRVEWIESSAFQLQRMAAEGRGIGPWEGRENSVPRLSEYGHLFSLTGQSLRGRWGRVESYQMVAKGPVDEVEELELETLNVDDRPRPRDMI